MSIGSENEGRLSLKKIIFYSVGIFLIAAFQASVGSRIGLFSATPSLTLAFTALTSLFESKKTGAVVGLAGGFLTDALGGAGFSLLPLFYTLTGWFLGEICERLGHPGRQALGAFLRSLMWLAAVSGAGAVFTAILIVLSAGRMNFFSSIPHILLPEAVSTLLWSLPMLGIFMLLYRKKFSE